MLMVCAECRHISLSPKGTTCHMDCRTIAVIIVRTFPRRLRALPLKPIRRPIIEWFQKLPVFFQRFRRRFKTLHLKMVSAKWPQEEPNDIQSKFNEQTPAWCCLETRMLSHGVHSLYNFSHLFNNSNNSYTIRQEGSGCLKLEYVHTYALYNIIVTHKAKQEAITPHPRSTS